MASPRPPRTLVVFGALLGFVAVFAAVGIARLAAPAGGCTPTGTHPGWSVARAWNEATLDAVRRDLPAPTVHSRNLFHLSAAMWDAWAAYDPGARGLFVDEDAAAADVVAARDEAISYAAYRVVEARYMNAAGASDSIPQFDALMRDLCHPTEVTTTVGDTPAALGNRIAATILGFGAADGANEAAGYDDPSYETVNPPLVVAASGTTVTDPNRWQPLQIAGMVSQNGIVLTEGVQEFIGPHWGHVRSFALPPGGGNGLPIDPGPPPYLGTDTDAAFKEAAVQVIRFSSTLDPTDGVMIDVSPASLGGNTLGANDGAGHPLNPATGQPYEPVMVNRADFGRAVAEFWADGPRSETPPGHWNVLANEVSDTLDPDLRIGGTGPVVDRLEWDVKLYLALNGANHDAAVAAWGAKGHYDYSRPISMIRYMGGRGQSSDPDGPAYHTDGLPLVTDLIEVITPETTAPGARHAALAGHEGEIAVRSWTGTPDDPETETAGVAWIRAVDWVPYQLPTFVTPSFAGYVSGHSTFSRASAEVMTSFTGSEFFPGGFASYTVPAGAFEFEAGPAGHVVLEWATYFDAADQAGISRLYGGIHVTADDLAGRLMGAACGRDAWDRVQVLYGASGA
jgi:hypothetical protein